MELIKALDKLREKSPNAEINKMYRIVEQNKDRSELIIEEESACSSMSIPEIKRIKLTSLRVTKVKLRKLLSPLKMEPAKLNNIPAAAFLRPKSSPQVEPEMLPTKEDLVIPEVVQPCKNEPAVIAQKEEYMQVPAVIAEEDGSAENIENSDCISKTSLVSKKLDGQLDKELFSKTLMDACLKANLETVKLLLKAGASAKFKRESDGLTVLMAAAVCSYPENEGPFEIAKLLLDAGADVNSVQEEGYSPLIYAVKRGHRKMAELFLLDGADVNHADDYDKRTAINWATHRNNKEMVALLLDYRANPVIKNRFGETAFYVAINEKHLELAKLLAFSQTSTWRLGLPTEFLKTSHFNEAKLVEYAEKQEGTFRKTSNIVRKTDKNIDEHLKKILTDLGLEKWCSVMADHEINYIKFLQLKQADLMELGICKLDDLKKISNFIEGSSNSTPCVQQSGKAQSRQRDIKISKVEKNTETEQKMTGCQIV